MFCSYIFAVVIGIFSGIKFSIIDGEKLNIKNLVFTLLLLTLSSNLCLLLRLP